MKLLEAAQLLVIGTVLLTFTTLSHLLFPHPLTLGNPGLFVEALFLAGLAFAGLAVRKLVFLGRVLAACAPSAGE